MFFAASARVLAQRSIKGGLAMPEARSIDSDADSHSQQVRADAAGAGSSAGRRKRDAARIARGLPGTGAGCRSSRAFPVATCRWRIWLFVAIVARLAVLVGPDSTSPFFPPLEEHPDRGSDDLWIVGERPGLKPSLSTSPSATCWRACWASAIGALLWRFPPAATRAHPVLYFVYVIPSRRCFPRSWRSWASARR